MGLERGYISQVDNTWRRHDGGDCYLMHVHTYKTLISWAMASGLMIGAAIVLGLWVVLR